MSPAPVPPEENGPFKAGFFFWVSTYDIVIWSISRNPAEDIVNFSTFSSIEKSFSINTKNLPSNSGLFSTTCSLNS